MKKFTVIGLIILVVVTGLSLCVAKGVFSSVTQNSHSNTPAVKASDSSLSGKTADVKGTGTGIVAMQEAAQAKQYLFAFFWKTKDNQTASMSEVLDAVMKTAGARARSVSV